MESDVLVSGGGIGGAVLAGILGRAGKKVVVVEKNAAAASFVRPEILWPASVSILRSLVPEDRLRSDAILPLRGLILHDGPRPLVTITTQHFQASGVQPCSTDPNRTSEHLLAQGEFELRRGTEVIDVLRDGARIRGVRGRDVASGREIELVAQLVIGDDGAHSKVREACGIELETKLFPVDFLCFGFEWPAALPESVGHAWLNLSGPSTGLMAMLALPLPMNRGAGVVIIRPRQIDEPRDVERAWQRFLSLDERIALVAAGRRFPADFTRVRRPWGHARRYGAAGAILIGDAAHPVSPAGGQGANMSVADADALAKILLRGASHPLVEYERARRDANESALSITRLAARIFSLPSWILPTRAAVYVLKRAGARPERVQQLLRYLSTAFQSVAVER